MKRFSTILFLIFACKIGVGQVIFRENMGNPSSNPTSIASNTFQNGSPIIFLGTADVRNSTQSSGYSGASAGGNILFNSSGEYFQISGINTSGGSNFSLSFGIKKSTNASTGSDLIVEVSTDGTNFNPVSFSSLPSGIGTSSPWYLTTIASLPIATNLRIKFRQVGSSTEYRIDDVVISQYSTIVPPNDLCSNAQSITPGGSCINGTTFNATDDWTGNIGCQSGNGDHPDVWYSFVASGTQAQIVTTSSGTFSGNIEVTLFSGTCPNALTIIGRECGASSLTAVFNGLTVNNTYYYIISNTPSGSGGAFQTCITNSTPPVVSGQDCSSAAILCNGDLFSQFASNAGNGLINEVTPTNSCFGYLDDGSFPGESQSKWFKFTIGCSGSLRFNINPNVSNNDYDWALWDITNGCSNKPNSLACNWAEGSSGSNGSTGACTNTNACRNAEPGKLYNSLWESPVPVIAGHTYALLVDNFSTSNNGFTLKFGGAGGTCSSGNAVIGPTSDFSYSNTSCGNYKFTKTCSTSYSTYLWNFGDGVTSNSSSPTHTYTSSGLVTVTLTITDALGCTSTSSKTFTVTVPTLSLTASSQATCFSSSAQVLYLPYSVVTGTPSKYSIVWNTSPTNSFVPVTNVSLPSNLISLNIPANTSAGLYSAVLTVNDNSGCASASFPFTVRINSIPSISLTSNSVNTCYSINAQTLNLPYTSTTESPSLYSIAWNSSPINSIANITDGSLPASPILISIPANNPSGIFTGNLSVKNDEGCESNPISINVNVNPNPSAPSVTGASRCSIGTLMLTATPPTGGTVEWYDAPTGGTLLNSLSSYTTPILNATTTYYVSSTSSSTNGSCTSTNRTAVIGTIYSNPSAPLGINNSRCGIGSVNISATVNSGETVDWYDVSSGGSTLTSGVGVTTYTTPSISNNTTYYAEARNSTSGCVSDLRTAVIATIYNNPSAPLATGASRCSTGTVMLTATPPTGGIVEWYDAPTVGIPLSNLSSYTTPILNATTTYYVSSTSSLADGQCTSLTRTSVIATINSNPSAPSVSGASRCSTGTVMLTATPPTGGIVEWYDASTGGTLLSNLSSYSTPILNATTTYYVSSISSLADGQCTSLIRTPVVATINSNPSAPSVSGASRCSTGTVILTATPPTGGIVEWYDVSTGGTSLSSLSSYTTPILNTTTTYYVSSISSSTNGSCTSTNRTAVIATIYTNPSAPLGINNSRCGTGAVNISATVNSGETVDWYDVSTGGSTLTSGVGVITYTTPSISNNTTYYAESRNITSGCVSATRASVVAEVKPKPVIPAQSATTCSGQPFFISPYNDPANSTIVPTGTTYTWTVANNPNVSGQSAVSSAQSTISQTLSSTSSTLQLITYTVTPSAAGCNGSTFIARVIVNPNPVIPAQVATICSGSSFMVTPATALPSTVVPSNTKYTWMVTPNVNISGENPQSILQTTISDTLTNNSNLPQLIQYDVTAETPAFCTTSFTLSITVNPLPTFSLSNPSALCEPSTINLSTLPEVITGGSSGLTFGYFFDPAATNALTSAQYNAVSTSGTYYIKSTNSPYSCTLVRPVVITVNPKPLINTPDSVAVCSATETVNITNPILYTGSTPGQSFSYFLNAAATNSYGTPNVADTGVYYIKGTLASSTGCSAIKRMKVWLKNVPPPPAVTSPVYLCQNDLGVAPLSASGVFPLRWFNLPAGGVSNAIAPRPSTAFDGEFKYYVSQIDTPCASPRAVILVKIFKKPNLGPDKELKVCYGTIVNLDTVFNFTNLTNGWYFINGTPVDNPNAVSAAGTYEVFVADSANCQDDAKVNIVILPKVTADARDSGIAILNTPHQLYGFGNGNQFEWTPSSYLNFSGIQNPIATLTADTKFYLTVTNAAGCKAYDTLLVKVLSNPGCYIPKAFTPNGDGLNDKLTVTPVGIQKLNYFRIYNRFGEKIFETASLGVGWDGTFKGIEQSQDSYVYVLSAVYQKGETKVTKGTVILIR